MTKPKWLDDHACAYNDGNCECKCFKTAYLQALQEAIEALERLTQDPDEIRKRVFEAQDFPNWSDATASGAYAFSYNSAVEDAVEKIQSLLASP